MQHGDTNIMARAIVVERLEQDLFRITWWRESGEKVYELARAASLTRRIDVLTIPESGPARLFAAEPYEQTQTANELAAADGADDYGNPVTPGCATGRLP